ncbi:MAG TPA: efflux RND transporter periplasmic adaptor subunit [Bacteroidales bacterium]|nr:efflux RND transporter periplasmic adaptor subunit [Bacteroidales bacterium]
MKKTLILTGIGFIAAFLLLYVFNKVTSENNTSELYTEVQNGEFVISVTVVGQLIAENSIDIKGPAFGQRRNIRSRHIKIQDLIPEGTIVNKGDYVAELDRTELENTLKDQREVLKTLQSNIEMKKLDTAVVLNPLRDGIRNQRFVIEEAGITLRNSKYESPTIIRRAEIQLNKSKRVLKQRQRSYKRTSAQSITDIYNQEYSISRVSQRVKDLEELLEGFTITSPANGMVIYKKEWMGNKRKIGSTISSYDRVVAILPDLSSMISKTFVSETDISKMKTGLNVNITVNAFPKKRFKGTVLSIANIGEKLQNTSDKVFEVQIKTGGSDPLLRPSMTTINKIIVNTIDYAVYVPVECVHAGADSISYVYTKNGDKQIVLLGDSNEKNIVIEKGLISGTIVYLNNPESPEKFNLIGEDLIPVIKERYKEIRAENSSYMN